MFPVASLPAPAQRTALSGLFSLAVLVLFASTGLLLTGCGIGTVAPSSPVSPVQGTGEFVQGKVHGGQQPVTGSTIQLWAASETGYPGTSGFTAPTALLKQAVTTGADGSFSITSDYTCPVGDAEVYITATGGNPGAGNNANLAMMAALGSCDNLLANASTTFISIDEVTTVASAYALAQFAEPNPSGTGILVGTSATNVQGLTNAMATVNNMVNLATGQAYTITPAYANNTVAYLNSSTVPQARINTLADILAACVNSTGLPSSNPGSSTCGILFTAATPSGGTAPTDTLQAILDIAQHPLPAAAPIALAAATSPFQPTLSTAPNDWVIGLTYVGAGLGNAGSLSNTGMAIDANGNVWVSAGSGSTTLLAEFNNQGAPLTPATTINTAVTPNVTTYGGFQYTSGGRAVAVNKPFAFDQNGNLWIGGEVEISAGGALEYYAINSLGGTNTTIDSSGNIWTNSGITSDDTLYEYSNSGALLNSATGGGTYGNGWYGLPSSLTFDSTNSYLWSSDASYTDLYKINATNGQLINDYYSSGAKITALVADGSGNVYGCPVAGSILQFNGTSNSPIATHTIASGRTCNSSPGGMVMDGLGHIWNSSNYSTLMVYGSIDEFTTAGAAISPVAVGYTGSSVAEGGSFMLVSPFLAIDGSGNLWVLSQNEGSQQGGNAPNPNVLTELVGVAAPVLTPKSLALSYGELATRP
jgi:hypothetical protein